MSAPTERWQHRRPKLITECDADPVRPLSPSHARCARCGDQIVRVGSDEGPEALKALLRF